MLNSFNLMSRPFPRPCQMLFQSRQRQPVHISFIILMSFDEVLESDDVVSGASASSKPDCRLNFSRYHISRFVTSLSISLLSVDVSDIGRYDDVRCGSFPDFNIGRTIACFQAFGRRPLRQIALNNRRIANLPVAGICWKNSYVI